MEARSRKTYFENLDGLRFWAAFVVVIFHMAIHLKFPDGYASKVVKQVMSLNWNGGTAGVSFFFVLSGFLITYLMFLENERRSSFSIPFFYVRRLLRIWPLYFLTLFIGFVAYPYAAAHFGRGQYEEQASVLLYSLFLANFDLLYFHIPTIGILGVQWSVSVEEQFYLVWPLLFYFTRNSRAFPWAVGAVVLLANAMRAVYIDDAALRWYHTLCCMNDLGIGALLAYIVFHAPDGIERFLKSLSRSKTMLIYAAGIAFVLSYGDIERVTALRYSARFVVALFFAFVILDQISSPHSFFKVGNIRLFTKLGKISYGLYLLHMIAITAVAFGNSKIKMHIVLQIALAASLTWLFSYWSYRFYETPFLNLKEKFSLLRKPAPAPARPLANASIN